MYELICAGFGLGRGQFVKKMTFVAEETINTLCSHAGRFRLLHEHTRYKRHVEETMHTAFPSI
jgi:hypothetical protein